MTDKAKPFPPLPDLHANLTQLTEWQERAVEIFEGALRAKEAVNEPHVLLQDLVETSLSGQMLSIEMLLESYGIDPEAVLREREQ